jgi:hypothetical protein
MASQEIQLNAFFRRCEDNADCPADLRAFANLFLYSNKEFRNKYLVTTAFRLMNDYGHMGR